MTAAVSGLGSSAGATTSAVVLYRAGTLSATGATVGILLVTGASVVVKAALTATTSERSFAIRVAGFSAALVAIGALAVVAVA